MKRKFVVVGLALAFVVACESDDPVEEQVTDMPEASEEQPVEEPQEEEPEGPPLRETDRPSDDEIGQLPDGVGLAVGEELPDVAATDADGEEVRLVDLVEDQTIALFFYRGGWCPFCNFQIRDMTQAFDDFAERGVLPVAVSVDQPSEAAKTQGAYEIPFPVLSDPDLEVHEAFQVTYQAEEEEVQKLAEMGMDLEASSGRDHNSYAIPGVFIIDSNATVRWAHANMDYSVRPSPKQLLEAIDGLE